jgi:hypothetical protein
MARLHTAKPIHPRFLCCFVGIAKVSMTSGRNALYDKRIVGQRKLKLML